MSTPHLFKVYLNARIVFFLNVCYCFFMQNKDFKKFQASSLYCPKCRRATAVREKLLLILPDGNLFDYYCSLCGTSVGKKKDSHTENKNIVLATR